MRIYTLGGDIITEDGNPKIFRKMTKSMREIEICKILKENTHENIVKIYEVYEAGLGHSETSYIDMELLDTNLDKFSIQEIQTKMLVVKEYLQNMGIMYIDWKSDNIGVDAEGNLVLFDFDGSGLVDKKGEWEYKPSFFYSYRKAIEAGKTDPREIDGYIFSLVDWSEK